VGRYARPKVRLPGAGGAPEIAASAGEVIVMLRHKRRAFVEELSFVTSVGHGAGGDSRGALGYPGAGPTVVITDLGVLRPDPRTKELTLVAVHPGATAEAAKEATGWDLRVAEETATTDPPTERELELLRDLKERTAAAREGRAE
jgi:glutaconate CoA-transferase subunit B